jgi:two-component system cell cycle sensor histidine kinase/response regulator CckA
MLGYTELLQAWNERPADGSSDHPEHEYLSELHRAAERASALTTQLLCYSRQTVGTPAPLDLSASVRTLRALLIRVLGPQIQLSVSAREIGRLVLADARQVEQALVNLALNARDALPTGGHVEIAVEPLRLTEPLDGSLGDAPDGDYVRVRVCDDGCGMNAETKAQLFRPFFTTKDRGTGLGLTIVARIARQCGAAITVESEPDRGTTFALYFPILSEQQTR